MIYYLIASLVANAILIPMLMWKSGRKEYYKNIFFAFKREHLAEMEDFRKKFNKLQEKTGTYEDLFDEFADGAAYKISKLGTIVDKHEGMGTAYEAVNAIDYEFSKHLKHLDFVELNKLLSKKLPNKRGKEGSPYAFEIRGNYNKRDNPVGSGGWTAPKSSPKSSPKPANKPRSSSGSSRSGGSSGSTWTPTPSYVYDDSPSSGGYGGSCGHSGGDSGGSSGGDGGFGGCD